MTAAQTTAVRVPGQAGPPAVEQIGPDPRERWRLVDAAKAGDREAFAELYRLYQPLVYRVARRRCGDHHLAEDLTSDTFVKALRNIERLEWQGRDPGAWFVTIARNLVLDHFKSGRFRLESNVAEVYDPASGHDRADPTPEGDPAGLVVAHHTNLTLLAAVQQLTPEQRECITLRFLQGLSIAEAAAAMGKRDGAMKALQYRATRALARLLPAGFETPEVPPMKNDPYTVITFSIGALVAGFILGAWVVALAARARQMDEGDRAGAAYRELRDAAQRCADPAYLAALMRDAANIWDRWRPDGLHLDAFYRRPADVELTPAYVHRIVDAYATGDPVDLSGCWVPPDVQGRLRAITIGASEATTALPGRPARDLITTVHPTDVIEQWPVHTGTRDG